MGLVNYNRTGEIIEIHIRDFSGAKIETHTCNVNDKKKYASILKYLRDKYGFEPEIDLDESVNAKTDNKKEIDWWM